MHLEYPGGIVMVVGVTREELALWVSVAFAVWVPLLLVLPRFRVKGRGAVAAIVSWLVARAALWALPLLHRYLVGGRSWH